MFIKSKKFIFTTGQAILEKWPSDLLQIKKDFDFYRITSYEKRDLKDFVRTEKTTALIDLTLPSEEIFSKFNDTTRNEINKTRRDANFSIKKLDTIDDSSYYLYKKFEFSQKRAPVSKEELKNCRAFLAYYNNELISGMFVFSGQGKYLRLRSIFSKRLAIENKDMYKHISNASRRIMWEICEWGKKNGYRSLDLASVNLASESTGSIARFKMSFGGELVSEYTYTYKSPFFRSLEFLGTLRAKARLFFRKI